ncbi:MAG: hypothetical protein ACYCTW_05960 [Sulfuricella sp.]
MNTVVIEHVALSELPAAWRARLPAEPNVRVTVRIEEEATQPILADNPLFGMWQDREEVADIAAYARQLRAPRYNLNGSRHED